MCVRTCVCVLILCIGIEGDYVRESHARVYLLLVFRVNISYVSTSIRLEAEKKKEAEFKKWERMDELVLGCSGLLGLPG